MDRRRVLAAMALAALAPRAGAAGGKRRLAILSIAGPETDQYFGPVLKGLADRGWRRGGNLEVSFYVVHEANTDALDKQARAAVESRPDAILTISTQATHALRRHTTTLPIVTSVGDPVGSGFAASVSIPGGHVTGLSQGFEVGALKGVEAVRSLVPGMRALAIFGGDGKVSHHLAGVIAAAALSIGVEPRQFIAKDDDTLKRAFAGVREASIPAGCWVVNPVDPRMGAEEAIKRRFPLVSIGSDLTSSGLLAAFTTAFPDSGERLAAVLARVLAGESPARIPFELPREFDIVLNLRTARAIGLAIPPELRVRATRLVE